MDLSLPPAAYSDKSPMRAAHANRLSSRQWANSNRARSWSASGRGANIGWLSWKAAFASASNATAGKSGLDSRPGHSRKCRIY
jgi:hypothetical protein